MLYCIIPPTNIDEEGSLSILYLNLAWSMFAGGTVACQWWSHSVGCFQRHVYHCFGERTTTIAHFVTLDLTSLQPPTHIDSETRLSQLRNVFNPNDQRDPEGNHG